MWRRGGQSSLGLQGHPGKEDTHRSWSQAAAGGDRKLRHSGSSAEGSKCSRKVGKSEFSLNFLSKTPLVHLVVGVSTETYNFKLKISSLVFRPETEL